MINSSIDFLVESIEKSQLIEKNPYTYQKYHNFFDPEFFGKIHEQLDSLSTTKLEGQLRFSRKRADYNQTLLKECKILFSHGKVREQLEKKYKISLKCQSVDIWFDYKGYFLTPHVDDDRIKLSIQIYLSNDTQPGTILCSRDNVQDKFDVFNYKSNCGYSMLNSDNCYHALEYPVQNGVRKSLYVRFG